MSGQNDVYPILLAIARNPVTAVGLPLALGTLSGLPTRKVTKGYWYQVSRMLPVSLTRKYIDHL